MDYNNINTRKISVIHIGGFRPTGDILTSNFGLTAMSYADEEWPKSFKDNENLFFLCQLNLTEAPYVPELLSDIKLITIFVDRDNWDSFCIRAYKNLDNLVPMKISEGATFKKGFEVKYELDIDQPVYDDDDLVLPKNINLLSLESDTIIDKLENKHCSKIGGYASSIQALFIQLNLNFACK